MRFSLRFSLAALAAFILGAAAAGAPADAAIGALTVTSADASQVGPCPTKILFTGLVGGTPGQTFGWIAVWKIDGAAGDTATLTPATLDASGKAKIAYQLTVPSTANAGSLNSFQFNTQTTGATVTNYNSAPISFSVTCVAATPSPAPTQTASPAPAVDAPKGVRPVASRDDCSSLPGAIPVICEDDVTFGALQLVWDESTHGVDKYEIYRVDGGRHDLVNAVVPGGVNSNPPPRYDAIPTNSGYGGECFAVVAAKGSATSQDSSRYCYASGATAKTETFHTSHTATELDWSSPSVSNCSAPISSSSFFNGADQDYGGAFTTLFPFLPNESALAGQVGLQTLYAGQENAFFTLNYHESIFSTCAAGELSSATTSVRATAGFAFDLSHVSRHKVFGAVLTLKPVETTHFDPAPSANYKDGQFRDSTNGTPWCDVVLGAASREWWIAPLGNLTYAESNRIELTSLPQGVDVSADVSTWASNDNANDYGFIIDSIVPRSAQALASNGCVTEFANPDLIVTYF